MGDHSQLFVAFLITVRFTFVFMKILCIVCVMGTCINQTFVCTFECKYLAYVYDLPWHVQGNFVLNVCQAQIGDDNIAANNIFENIDSAFTVVFTIELCVNVFATFFWEFVTDAWNWFDVIVVLVSLISLVHSTRVQFFSVAAM